MDAVFANSYGAIISALKGESGLPPVDPTTDFERWIPHARGVARLNLGNTDYSERKPVTIQYFATKGYVTDAVLVLGNFAAQVARNKTDKMCYCDYPVLNQFKSVEIKAGQYQVENLTPKIMIRRMENFCGENFDGIVEEWLGGNAKNNHKNQRYEGFSGYVYNEKDFNQNIIKPEYEWLLPIVCSLLTGNEKFKYGLCTKSMLEFTFNFQTIKNFTTRSPDIQLKEVDGSLTAYVVYTNPVDVYIHFNTLPYLQNKEDSNYYFTDVVYELTSKKFASNQDFKLPIKSGPTKRFKIDFNNTVFNDNNRFYGNTVEESSKRFVASMIKNSPTNTSQTGTIDLSAGVFVSSDVMVHNKKFSGPWEIRDFDSNGNWFNLVYKSSNQVEFYTKIESPHVPWSKIGDSLNVSIDSTTNDSVHLKKMFLDLGTYMQDEINNSSGPRIYHLKRIVLDIRPYDSKYESWSNQIDRSIISEYAFKLVNGVFAYSNHLNTDTTSPNMAFWGVSQVERRHEFDEVAYNYLFSLPITNSPNSCSMFVLKDLVLINRPNYSSYDLDKKVPIRITELLWEKLSGINETFDKTIMRLIRDFRKKPNPEFDADVEIDWEFINYLHGKRIHSGGYQDMADAEFAYSYIVFKFEQIELLFFNKSVDSVSTIRNRLTHNIEITSYQEMIRELKYSHDGYLELVGPEERVELNKELNNKVLQENGFTQEIRVVENQSKRIRTDNYGGSLNRTVDHNSFNNTILKNNTTLKRSLANANVSFVGAPGIPPQRIANIPNLTNQSSNFGTGLM